MTGEGLEPKLGAEDVSELAEAMDSQLVTEQVNSEVQLSPYRGRYGPTLRQRRTIDGLTALRSMTRFSNIVGAEEAARQNANIRQNRQKAHDDVVDMTARRRMYEAHKPKLK